MERLGKIEPGIEPQCPTKSESVVCELINKRRSQFEAVMTCAGPNISQAPRNTLSVYTPNDFEDLNPAVQSAVKTRILEIWKQKFSEKGRINNFEVVLHDIPYPFGTKYTCKLIFLLKKDGVEFVHPFKGTVNIDLPL